MTLYTYNYFISLANQAKERPSRGRQEEDTDLPRLLEFVLYTTPCIIVVMKQRERWQWDKDSIRTLRCYLGVTQKKLAKELGTRQQTISEWETGIYQPRGTSTTLLSIVAERSGFSYKLKEENGKH